MSLSLLIVMMACTAPGESGSDATSVGNPGKMTARSAQGKDAEYSDGTFESESLVLSACDDDEDTWVELNQTLDLVNGSTLALPAGEWCGLELSGQPPLVLQGSLDDGTPFTLTLQIDAIHLGLSEGFTVDDDAFVLELAAPGWFDAETLREGADRLVEIDDGHELHDRLAAAIARGSALYRDSDDDGEVAEDERDRGSEARGEEREEETREDQARDTGRDEADTGGEGDDDGASESEPAGCRSGEIQVGWLIWPWIFWGRRGRHGCIEGEDRENGDRSDRP
jgi:hypothetical protein